MTNRTMLPPDASAIDVLRRITKAPTTALKVRALLAAIDWGECQPPPPASFSPIKYDRLRYQFGVCAFAWFLKSLGRQDLNARFWELGSALSDLDDGTVRPFLEPALRTRADGSDKWRARSYVAMAVDALRRAGMERKEVAQYIVNDFSGLTVLVQNGKELFDSVLSWRDQFHKGKIKNLEGATRYQCYLELCPPDTPSEALRAHAAIALASAMAEARAIGRP